MPAATISNGRTGALKPVSLAQSKEYWQFISLGASCEPSDSVLDVARRTAGHRLHVCELWMPGRCNLSCRHCYVSSRGKANTMTESDFALITRRLVRAGMRDVVIPGMEPLLRKELWPVLQAAKEEGAETIGITTNGTMLEPQVTRLNEAGLTAINVSLDGTESIHDWIRGSGVFRKAISGLEAVKSRTPIRTITNTTVHKANLKNVTEIGRLALNLGLDYAAFHPYEWSSESEQSLAANAAEVADVFEALINAFYRGFTGSIVLETEASTFDAYLELLERDCLSDLELASDERGYLFLVGRHRNHELLINLMAYPRHYVHAIRVAHNGGLTSCRDMARTDWVGHGDLRVSTAEELLHHPEIVDSLALIWAEFRQALARSPAAGMQRLHEQLFKEKPINSFGESKWANTPDITRPLQHAA